VEEQLKASYLLTPDWFFVVTGKVFLSWRAQPSAFSSCDYKHSSFSKSSRREGLIGSAGWLFSFFFGSAFLFQALDSWVNHRCGVFAQPLSLHTG